jgi:DNA replication and repair protein RecF
MYLTHLALTDFRLFTRLNQDVPRRIVLLVGDNAQGKTSLLEAIYYLATFTSFHAQNDRQLIHFAAAERPQGVARLVADYVKGTKKHHLEVRLIQELNGAGTPPRFRKEILLDGVKRNANDVIGHFNAVIFLPQMTRILEQGPEERRRYLNLALSQAVPGYALALSEYNQALTQRNALLKQLSERMGGDPDQLTFWDDLIARRGAQLMVARIATIRDLERSAGRIHARLTHSGEVLRLVYQPAYEPLPQPTGQYSLPILTPVDRTGLSVEQIQEGFCQRLKELRNEEIVRGMTTIGPHRDEMRCLNNGIDLGDYGSRGQIRTALLALKLAEVVWMKEKTGHSPVLLLDEILAELDIQRRHDLLETLYESEQGLLTTTDVKLFDENFVHQATLWEVQGGAIRQLGINASGG